MSKLVSHDSVHALALEKGRGGSGVRAASGHADHSVCLWDLRGKNRISQVSYLIRFCCVRYDDLMYLYISLDD